MSREHHKGNQMIQFIMGKRSWIPALRPLGAILAGIIFCESISHGASSKGFTVVSKGEPKAEIVVGEHSEPPVLFAAQELQRYVNEMSGAKLELVHATSKKPSIVLAVRPLQQDRKAAEDPREEDHYRLNIDAKTLQIEGASPRAVLFGVYDVLERLGCGWCVPGDDAVPKHDALTLPALQADTRPAFQYRMMVEFPMMSVAQSIAIADWLAKNRMNWVHPAPNAHGEPKLWYDRRDQVLPEYKKRGLHVNIGGHTMHTWVPKTNNFAAHPEWFAYNGGERKGPTLCVANLEMTVEAIKNIQHFLERCPEVEIVDFWHPDDEVFCHCSKCTRGLLPESTKGKQPEWMATNAVKSAYLISYIEFINRVAQGIAKTHPKVMVSPLMYALTEQAMLEDCPAMADNVIAGLAHIMRDSYRPLAGEPQSTINERFLGIDLTWISKSKHHYIYEYYNCWIAPFIYPGAQVIARDLQIMETLGVQGSSSDMWGYSPINMYVAARALWSSSIPWKAAVREFCTRYYGDVGEAMAENELRLETEIFGRTGYQASGARDPEKWKEPPTAGLYLREQRSGQITFLKGLIAKTKDPKVKVRLERQLKPWTVWEKDARWWAVPEFKDAK
jgi:hypothetical protein